MDEEVADEGVGDKGVGDEGVGDEGVGVGVSGCVSSSPEAPVTWLREERRAADEGDVEGRCVCVVIDLR